MRKQLKVRPGFRPVEDVERYRPPQSRLNDASSSPKEVDKKSVEDDGRNASMDILNRRSPSPSPLPRDRDSDQDEDKRSDSAAKREVEESDASKSNKDNKEEEDELTSKLSSLQIGSMASRYASAQPVKQQEPEVSTWERGRGRGQGRGRGRGRNRGRGRSQGTHRDT